MFFRKLTISYPPSPPSSSIGLVEDQDAVPGQVILVGSKARGRVEVLPAHKIEKASRRQIGLSENPAVLGVVAQALPPELRRKYILKALPVLLKKRRSVKIINQLNMCVRSI